MYSKIIAETCVAKESAPNFWRAVDIYLFKTHVINKKLFGVKNVSILSYKDDSSTNGAPFPGELVDKVAGLEPERFESDTKQLLLDRGCDVVVESRDTSSVELLSLTDRTGLIVLNRLLPKNIQLFQPIDVVCSIDFRSFSVQLKCRSNDRANSLFPKFPFALQVADGMLSIRCHSGDEIDERSTYWLREVPLERMHKWMESSIPTNASGESTSSVRSLALVDNLEEYNRLFHELKQKYGLSMVSIWPECTDPQKFVYEDIAIAAYLLTLWKTERERSAIDRLQSFVDIGCGNGLLVYILASEGHRGYGIDLRKRKLWDLYPAELGIDLRVQTIVPSSASLFPDIDWIIGNHSDELSPWIPVIAARSSYDCRFFLLPCCAFEFDGRKYQRQNCALSQYGDFLNYAKEIAQVCGFGVETDRLRIPSTKRTCLVGVKRNYPESEYEDYDATITSFINNRSRATEQRAQNEGTTDDGCGPGGWSAHFKPRESIERVRNCTKIERSVVDKIVLLVFDELLAKRRILPTMEDRSWNAGGTITLEALVKEIPREYLEALKAECGGLQTLLKNNHQIFRVENGTVQLRIPTKASEPLGPTSARKTRKMKHLKPVNFKLRNCWFFINHPDGCPLVESECRFNHGTG